MNAGNNEDVRMEMLCKRLGRMWSAKVNINVDKVNDSTRIKDGSQTLIGQLFQNPRINFHAFQQTMKKVWRMENIEFTPLDDGIFAITFSTKNEMRRILEQGPWSFANHLLLLQNWRPATTAIAYKFTACMFWVHIMGVPFEWGTSDFMRELVRDLGMIQEVKIETKGMVTYGRVRVTMDLNKPLQSGVLVHNGGRKIWLDFKYERLPKFCYLCGKIGHYMAECEDELHNGDKVLAEDERLFGPWLKAEDDGKSPFWQVFYNDTPSGGREEMSGFEHAGQLVLYSVDRGETSSMSGIHQDVPRATSLFPVYVEKEEEVDDRRLEQPSLLPKKSSSSMLLEEEVDGQRGKIGGKRTTGRKKVNRFCPYVTVTGAANRDNEEQLLEIPVQRMECSETWAWVASPNKPPGVL